MSLDQKIALVHGQVSSTYVGLTPAVPALCIPAMNLQDGPAGVGDGASGVTQLPAPVALASMWDPNAALVYGSIIGQELSGKGAVVALAPTVNMVRDPRWGRAFETLGEDPFLTGKTAVAIIQGIQNEGVMAQVKHLAVYNQQTNRDTSADDAIVDTRAVQEIYLPAFEAAVTDGAVASVMCAYSTINGTPACQNSYLESAVLRGQLGFRGFVTSDWWAMKSTADSAAAGTDQEMPWPSYYASPLESAISSKAVLLPTLDKMVSRLLTQAFAFGLFDRAPTGSPQATVTNAAHAAAARDLAAEGVVLLKNAYGLLPLAPTTRAIAVIGAAGDTSAQYAGIGSAAVTAPYSVSPLAGIRSRAGAGVRVTYDDGSSLRSAIGAAAAADVAIVVASLAEGEWSDLSNIDLPGNQNAVIEAVASVNPRTVVVLNTGSAVTMPWASGVAGILEAWYPGQESGNAIASVLFGDVNPSGHLPVTFPLSLSDVPASTPAQWPGMNGSVQYSEGLDVGYRWYDAWNITPLFPFGFGLSYTSFGFSRLRVSVLGPGGDATIQATVTNTGSRSGADVAQLYVSAPAAIGEPPKALKGFQRVQLAPGARATVSFTVRLRDLAYFDDVTGWQTPPGIYAVGVGDSSRNLPLQGTLQVIAPAPAVVNIVNPGPQNLTVGTPSSLPLIATDSTGSPVIFAATGLPPGMVLTPDGLLAGTPTTSGTTTVNVTASDIAGASATSTFVLTVNAVDGAGGPTGTITGAGGLCVDLPYGANRDGTAIQLSTCDGTNEQEWTVRFDGTLQAEGKCLDIAAGGTLSGRLAQLSTCSGAASQHWQAGANGELVNTASGLCLDVSGSQAAAGATLSVATCTGTRTQRWVLP